MSWEEILLVGGRPTLQLGVLHVSKVWGRAIETRAGCTARWDVVLTVQPPH